MKTYRTMPVGPMTYQQKVARVGERVLQLAEVAKVWQKRAARAKFTGNQDADVYRQNMTITIQEARNAFHDWQYA